MTELQHPPIQFPFVHDGRLAKRSPGYGDGLAADGVIAQLVNAHNGNRIGLRLAFMVHPDHRIAGKNLS